MKKNKQKLRTQVAEQIKFWRKKRGLTQAELAEKAGLASKTVISGYENALRAPSFDVLEKFAEILEVKVELLFKGDV